MGHDAGQPYYTLNFIWSLSYPSESWIVRRTLAWVIMAAAGFAIIFLGEFGPASWLGVAIAILAWGYGLYLAEVGYANTRRWREAQDLPPED